MANRYWVGGTGTWNTTSTTNWSASSGGASGASVPTAADNVFFDQAATYTVTMTGALTCLDLTVSAGTVTFATGTSPTLAVSGSFSIVAATVWSATGTITFNATTTGKTVTTNGVTINGNMTFNGVGGGWALGSNLTASLRNISVDAGAFDTNGFDTTAASFFSSGAGVRTVYLRTGTHTYTGNFSMTTGTNLTFDAGTSQINLSGTSSTVSHSGQTFYNVSFTSTSSSIRTISGSGTATFNNLTFGAPSSAGLTAATEFGTNITVNGTLTASGATAQQRVYLRSSAPGTQRTLTVNAFSASPADIDFADIVIAGAAAGTTITRGGDCGNNSGVTLATPRTVYWNLAGTTTWLGSTGWATSSGGVPAVNNVALPQDTAVFDNTGSVGTFNINGANAGAISAGGRTSAMTLTLVGYGFGDVTLGTGVTTTSTTNFLELRKNGTLTITSNGVTINSPITVNNPNTTASLGDALSLLSSRALTLTRGTFDANNKNVSVGQFVSSGTITRTLTMGSGTWTLSGTGTVWALGTTTGLTFNKGTANIVLSDTTTTARTFAGGGLTYNNLTIGGASGTSTLTISGSNTFADLSSTKTVAHTISFTGGTTQTFGAFSVTGTPGNVVTIGSTNTTQVTLKKPGPWYVGANSTDGGNNVGLIFSAGGGIDYLSISRITGINTTAANGLLFGSNF